MADRQKSWRYFHSTAATPTSVSESVPIKGDFSGIVRKKKLNTAEDNLKRATKKKESAKKKQDKKKRIIIRNLSFKIDEEELKNILSKYGNVTDLKIPKKPDGKKKGFAFAQFEKFKSTVQAIKNLNYKELRGRPIAIDYALPKDKFEDINSSKLANTKKSDNSKSSEVETDSESESSDEDNVSADIEDEKVDEEPANKTVDDQRVDDLLREFEFDADTDDEMKDNEDVSDSSEDEDNDDDNSIKEENEKLCDDGDSVKTSPKSKPGLDKSKKVPSNDVQEGKTVFVRNISFDTTQENFQEAIEEFGPVKYCLLCIDPVTEFPRGTAFVKFENKEDAEKLVKKSSEESGTGVFFENRKLYCVPAMSREDVKQKTASNPKERKDKRNLRLLKEGLITVPSEKAEGVSETDLAKRSKLEIMKKQKLKNLNFFVSDTRLCIHNLPQTYTDQQLRSLFREAVSKKVVITEARIMRDLKKVNEKGDAKSKGFGFVSFVEHEAALEALQKLNNNPTVFSDKKRPIVEFSVENHQALLSKQRRRDRNNQRNKRKEQEAGGQTDNYQQSQSGRAAGNSNNNNNNNKRWKKQRLIKPKSENPMQKNFTKKFQKQSPGIYQKFTIPEAVTSAQENKKTNNKKAKKKNEAMKKTEYKNLTNLVDQYKTKLLNKLK